MGDMIHLDRGYGIQTRGIHKIQWILVSTIWLQFESILMVRFLQKISEFWFLFSFVKLQIEEQCDQ